MSRQEVRSHWRFGILIIVILGVLAFQPAGADKPIADRVGNESTEQESLEVRYARAHLKLAKLDLRRVLEAQARHPGLLGSASSEDLRRHVTIDEEQLKQALKGPDGDVHQIYIRSAKIAVDHAEADLKRKQQTYAELPEKISAMEIERAKAVLEVARLHLEIANARQTALPSVMYLQWQIEVLRNQVLELQLQIQKLEKIAG